MFLRDHRVDGTGKSQLRWPAYLAAIDAGGHHFTGEAIPALTVKTLAYTAAGAVAQIGGTAVYLCGPAADQVTGTETTLDPKTREGIRASLAALDQVIADAATLQRATPDDPRSAHYLTSALQKKLDVLRTVTRRTAIRT